jgi:fumarate reductase subunit D
MRGTPTTFEFFERHGAKLGVLAAVVALGADQGYLIPLRGLQPEYAGLSGLGLSFIVAGFALGLLGMPLYLAGHFAVHRALSSQGDRAARAYWLTSLAGTITVVVTHSAIGVATLYEVVFWKQATPSPFAELAWRFLLTPLYALATAFFAAGTVAFVWVVRRGRGPFPRWMAWANPITLYLTILLATSSPKVVADFVNPSASHLASLGYFALLVAFSPKS